MYTYNQKTKDYEAAYILYWTTHQVARPDWNEFRIECYDAALIRMKIQATYNFGVANSYSEVVDTYTRIMNSIG